MPNAFKYFITFVDANMTLKIEFCKFFLIFFLIFSCSSAKKTPKSNVPKDLKLSDSVFNKAYKQSTNQTNNLLALQFYTKNALAVSVYFDSAMQQLDYVLPWQQPLRLSKKQIIENPWQKNFLLLPQAAATTLFNTGKTSLHTKEAILDLTSTGFKNQKVFINDSITFLPSITLKGSDSANYICLLSENLPILFEIDSIVKDIKLINSNVKQKEMLKRRPIVLKSLDTLNYALTTMTDAAMPLKVIYQNADSFGTYYVVNGETFEPIYSFKNTIISPYKNIKNPIFNPFTPSLTLTHIENEPQCFFIDSQTVKTWIIKGKDSINVESMNEENGDDILNKTVLEVKKLGQFNHFLELVKVKKELNTYGLVKLQNKSQTIEIELLKTNNGYILYSILNKDLYWSIKLLSVD